MTRRYTVLRSASGCGSHGPSGALESFNVSSDTTASTPPQPRIDVEDLSRRDVRDIARDPEVGAIAPVMPVTLVKPFTRSELRASAEDMADTVAPDAPPWGIHAVKADVSSFDGNGVVVAVLDTGVDAAHPAFRDVSLMQRDFTGSGDGDINGHGTHCAGTIFGRDVDGMRIGVARGVKRALIGKVLGDSGSGESSTIFRAIQWALDEGAKVISMSLGFDFPGLVERLKTEGWPVDLATSVALEAYRGNLRMFDALMSLAQRRAVFDGGAVVVAAAGNESKREINPQYEIAVSIPAAAEGVVSVGALGKVGDGLGVANFSNTLPEVSAPGVAILSAKSGGGLKMLSGTSMATPHVAGVAALWWHSLRNSGAPVNARNVVARLLATARADVFESNVELADRGAGLVVAP